MAHRRPLPALAIVFLTLVTLNAWGQSAQRGRALFEQRTCTQCHAFEARGLGPSVREMKGRLKGDSGKAAAALASAFGHGDDLKSLPRDDVRAIADWLAGSGAAAESPVAASPPAAKAEALDTPASRREAKLAAKREAEAKARQEAEAKAQARKAAAEKAKQDAEARAQAKREASELARREAEAKSRKDTAALDALKRENEDRARREADLQAAQKREAEERVRREAEAKAKADAQLAQKREAEAKARAEATPSTKREAEPPARIEVAKADSSPSGGRKQIAYRDGSDLPPCAAPTGAPLGAVDEDRAKAIIDRVGCPQCHAYIQKKTGPPMKKIHEKYKGDWECVVFRLKKNKTHNEEGVTDDLKGPEFKMVADYIATRQK